MVAGHTKNLAAYVDGLRPEIPDFLGGIHKGLEQYGRLLKRRHGGGMKRSLKFDYASLTLYMDVKLPNSDEWLKVDWVMAKDELAEMDRATSASTRKRLTSSTSSATEDSIGKNPSSPTTPLSGANNMPVSSTLRRHLGDLPAPNPHGAARIRTCPPPACKLKHREAPNPG